MSWTEKRIELLKKYWSKGMSASQIAETLGDVTRNAVIGKAHRLGLNARPSPVKGPVEKKPAPKQPKPVEPRFSRFSRAAILLMASSKE